MIYYPNSVPKILTERLSGRKAI